MFVFQKYTARFQKLCQPGIRVLVLAIALIALAVLSFQGFTLGPGNGSPPLFPAPGKGGFTGFSSSKSGELEEATAPIDSDNYPPPIQEEQNRGPPAAGAKDEHHGEMGETDDEGPDDPDVEEEESQEDDEFSIDLGNGIRIKKVKDPHGGSITLERAVAAGSNSSVGLDEEPGIGFKSASSTDGRTNSSQSWDKVSNSDNSSPAPSVASHPVSASVDKGTQDKQSNKSDDSSVNVVANISPSGEGRKETNQLVAKTEEKKPLQSGVILPHCRRPRDHAAKEEEEKKAAVTMSEMYQILLKNRGSSCSMVPRWSSPSDRQILEAKRQIVDAPIVENDPELYSPVFRNLSMFTRSYGLMEKMLKVYIYKEGEQPIFHQPPLTGIYASEGWFMKHMEASRRFVVDDPGKAHLFYMPFSSSRLRFQLYVPGLHHRNLVDYLKNYVGTIAGKYPFWNRTGGADHFLAACHDWATDETGKAMGNSIRALCDADVTRGFELGKDVSLPETNVPSGEDLRRDVDGGRPTKKRPFLAFFAGRMHGYLRPILLQHWGRNKDPDMKVFGQLHPRSGGRGGGRKKTAAYVQYMKSSRYCICPRGYEVNSPRLVESIFYGCVPVIISDNFVPPFLEVLNWEAFSVAVPERDVPRLKEILVSIPRKRYLALQAGVSGVRQHFLWHHRPVKYDLFHMILHSVWLNRVLSFHSG